MTSSISTPHETEILDGLTEPQRQAVTHVDGPLLVLAGPGSGKTRVITQRIAYLVRCVGIAPWNVLAITFTNKAATEMNHRVAQRMTEGQARAVTVSTFHSLCARTLRRYGEYLGLPPGYSIYDSSDQNRAMKKTLTDLQINPSNFPPGKVLATISKAKNELLDPQAYAAQASDYYARMVAEIYKAYQKNLTKSNALDFDDLLMRTVNLVRDHPTVLEELRERYQYVLVDEYQDTNHAQFVLAHALCAQHQNLCATGDPDQSIYGWRGADIRNILDIESHFPGVATVRLEQNYRSTKNIIAAADALIQLNTHRRHKTLWTENDEGEPLDAITCNDEHQEARWVVDWLVNHHHKNDVSWSDMAVFYRINSLSRVMEEALRTANIPYQIARGTAFYDRKEIKDALAYLRVIANPADEINLLRIINTPARKISANTVKAMQTHATAAGLTLGQVVADPDHVVALKPRAIAAIKKFHEMCTAWRQEAGIDVDDQASVTPAPQDGTPSLRVFLERVLHESGLKDYYAGDASDPDQERLMNLGELISSAGQFDDEFDAFPQEGFDSDQPPTLAQKLEAYLEQISLVSDIDAIDTTQGAVTLMTLHAAKGLEFTAVAMIGVEENLLPHSRAQTNNHELEEERRLCFVGITRSKRRLAMTHARFRTVFGQIQPTIPSRFLSEIPDQHMTQTDLTQTEETRGRGYEYTYDDADPPAGDDLDSGDSNDRGGLNPGARVRHRDFGVGQVMSVQPAGAQTRARVKFLTVGVKTLVLQYARLEKI